MRRRRPLLVSALAGTLLLGAVPLAHAAFVDSAAAAASLTAGQLAAPTGLTVQKRCTLGALGIVLGAYLDLAWTPSTTTWASGQRVVVTGSSGFSSTQNLGPTATSTTVTLPLVSGGTYTSTVRATYGGWTSPVVSVSTSGC